MYTEKYNNQYRKYVNFIKKYRKASNAATGSEVDSNANVEKKNISTCSEELCKRDKIGCNRLLMIDKITEMFGSDLAEEYIRQLDCHEVYKQDETSIMPYCVSITMYPFLFDGLTNLGGQSTAPNNLDSFCGEFINLVFAIAAQFAGAVSTPEFLMYMDYFIRKDYGDDYYLKENDVITSPIVKRQRTIDNVITDKFEQVVHSINQPAAARGYQAVFWNIAYFDAPYFNGMFEDFVFPDGTSPNWESVKWLQKKFMKWFNKERLRTMLTFPVETMNLLTDGNNFVDKEMADFTAEMWSEGHSFFLYNSDSVDSLASCCFDGSQTCLTRSSNGVNLMSFKDLYDSLYKDTKRNFKIFHNGSWVQGKPIRLPKRNMYKIQTVNNKELFVTDNHIHPTLNGDKKTIELTTDDYILFNNMTLDTFAEKDMKLTYEQGFLIGMYLGDGSMYEYSTCNSTTINLSINENKYINSIEIIRKALSQWGIDANVNLGREYNNVYPVTINSVELANIIKYWVNGSYCYNKSLNMNCAEQSITFRNGILDGYYLTDGGNSNRIYTTSPQLASDIECLCTTLGLHTVIDASDRTNEPVVIRGESFTRNYPLYCVRWYDHKNKRNFKDTYVIKNNNTYFKIKSIEKVESSDEFVYCFEMTNIDEPYFTLPNGIITHNCRLRNEVQDNEFSYTLGAGGVSTGSKGVMTINLNRLVQNAVSNNISLEIAVSQQVEKIHKYLLAFNEIIKDNFNSHLLNVYDAQYISLDKQYLTIGINGFVEGAEFLGIHISPNDEYFKYGETILKPIYELNKRDKTKDIMFNTEFVPAENLGVKNAKWDKEDGYIVSRDCYNSYFYLVEDDGCNILDKFTLHGNKLTKYLDGGSALHANLSEHLTKDQYLNLMRVAVREGCNYFTFNIPNTICNDCGYISKHKLTECPKCHSTNLDYATRIIGYLKRVSSFSESRQKEAENRYYAKS